jgi:ATP-dependent RNA helicase HelY
LRDRFIAGLSFAVDPFQADALDALDAGRSVLVAAPTGSGKTLVAAYGVARALAAGGKAFYTTPLKALSNQKFGELAAEHGAARVGLLTGDIAIRPDAPVVVMTTEVLRNMLLAGSDLLADLRTVVLDEVHYLQDPYRGGVWEEVLVLSPPGIAFVCLSATVANATELGAWLRTVRGPTDVVVERRRPVVLRHHLAVHHRHGGGETELLPLLVDGRVGGEALRLDQTAQRLGRARASGHWRGRPQLPFRAPRRTELVEALGDDDLLPAIVFIFSRAACDEAVRQCLRDGVRLTDHRQRATIRQIAEAHVASLADDDLRVLGFSEWLEGLEAGVAAHHAGLVPAYREAVEACFSAGLLQVVFATETLSLGINMPARSVVIERFSKFGGAGRANLTSGEYAQLTGRAGRRGLDDVGHAVVVWSAEVTAAEAARVAVAPPPDLRSAFRPTYNLTVNLVRRFDRPTAENVLRQSFAQWQATSDGNLVELLGRRLAVLGDMAYLDGWRLTGAGSRLARVYHESDLLVAEAVAGDVLAGADPSILAGVLSAVIFERRRARRPVGAPARRKKLADRLGEKRRAELGQRLADLADLADRVRASEEAHLVPRTRQPEPGLASAVTSWARGASFGTVLDVAAQDVGEIAPGDFVRTVKQLIDLVGQVSVVAPDPAVAAAASAAVDLLRRDVVAGEASTTAEVPPS